MLMLMQLLHMKRHCCIRTQQTDAVDSHHSTEHGFWVDSDDESKTKLKRSHAVGKSNENYFRECERNDKWKNADCKISYEVAHKHLETTSSTIKKDFLNHLRASAMMIKSIHMEHEDTKEKVTNIKTDVDFKLLGQKQALFNALHPVTKRQDALEAKVDAMSA